MKYRLLYFASLRDAAGRSAETVQSDAGNLLSLYRELATRHGFVLEPERLRVALNGEFTHWDQALTDNDEVVFLPPVSGG